MESKINNLKKKSMNLPLSPGVYLMKSKENDIIYIGKAKNLKNRVSSYFGSQTNHSDKVRKMVLCVDDFEYILTDSEFEALILECSLIKQHSPKYNILLKDDKGYHYIKITKDKWRKITLSKQKLNDDAQYIGPYTSAWSIKQAVEEARKIFKLPTCNLSFPKDIGRRRPCLNYHINLCSAPCIGKMSFSEYDEAVSAALDFLVGGGNKSIAELTKKMMKASDDLEFERAARLRDSVNSIKRIREKQKVISTKIKDQDVIAISQGINKSCFSVFRFSDYMLKDKEDFIINSTDEKKAVRSEFITRYYSIRHSIPKVITLDGNIDDIEIIERFLNEKSGRKVEIKIPQKGDQLSLVKMCYNNASERLAQVEGKITGKETTKLEELKELLNLNNLPQYIEAYDISNLNGGENVGGMVVFKDAKPFKKAYRKFKIKGVLGQDDYKSISEVIRRRFEEYKKADQKDEGFAKLPDLILLDGGKGQVSAVKPVLRELKIDVPVYGMVKDNKHKTRAIAKDGGEIEINSKRNVFSFITNIQDEVHRYAISYHRKLRNKNTFSSNLTKIDGIGEKRAKELLKYFKTLKNIENASAEDLSNMENLSKKLANKIYEYYHGVDK